MSFGSHKNSLLTTLLVLVLASCGQPASETSDDDNTSSGLPPYPVNQPSPYTSREVNPEQTVPVDVAVSSRAALGTYSLLTSAATDYTLAVESCTSTYSNASVTKAQVDADSGLELYLYDQNCVVKLKQFDFDYDGDTISETFSPTNTGGADFTDFSDYSSSGETATFTDTRGNILWVRIESQVPSPITTSHSVEFSFSKVTQGTGSTTLLTTVVSSGTAINAGAAGPNFSVSSTENKGINGSDGGIFLFVLECAAGGGLSDDTDPDATDSSCDGQKLADIDYILVDDTFSGGGVTAGELATAFSTGSPVAVAAANVYLNGDDNPLAPAGGFDTDDTNGPDDIVANPDMILAVRYTDPTLGTLIGYLWFEVDVTLSVNP